MQRMVGIQFEAFRLGRYGGEYRPLEALDDVPYVCLRPSACRWVSPHTIRKYTGMRQPDARIAINKVCEKGRMYQAQDGRYYCTPSGRTLNERP